MITIHQANNGWIIELTLNGESAAATYVEHSTMAALAQVEKLLKVATGEETEQ